MIKKILLKEILPYQNNPKVHSSEQIEKIANSIRDYGYVQKIAVGGTTFIACEKTGRKCYGMEIDPVYCQVILDRWEQFTGGKAEKVS